MRALLPIVAALAASAHAAMAQTPAAPERLAEETLAMLRTISVSGREGPAADLVAHQLAGLPVRRDALGDVTLTMGSGAPRRFLACTLDEPGYVVTAIRPDGYLRLAAVGRPAGGLFDQSLEGQVVEIVTARGRVPGALGVRSTHLQPRARAEAMPPFTLEDAYIDVGATSAAEVRAQGIGLLDPVGLLRRPARLAGGWVAAPAAAQKGACVAMLDAARRAAQAARPGAGTTTFAWLTRGRINGQGLDAVTPDSVHYDDVVLVSEGFWAPTRADTASPPGPGSGFLAAGAAEGLPGALRASFPAARPGPSPWGAARVGQVALPARYHGTQVETIALTDLARLADALASWSVGRTQGRVADAPIPQPPRNALLQPAAARTEGARLLAGLVGRYGVSGAEGPVRDEIRRLLPAWARPQVDGKGNLYVTVGQGAPRRAFIAHMDEVGFRVDSVAADGRLALTGLGGFYPSLWEGQAALVHTAAGRDVPGVFEPRADWSTARVRTPPALRLWLGTDGRSATQALGIGPGATATMPKEMLRLGAHRATGRSFDDRVGCTALLLALRQLDRSRVRGTVTFAWVVEEEVGLVGSEALAPELPGTGLVYAVDTFVSSDAPLESQRYADIPLGAGAVVRAMDNSNVAPRLDVERVLALGARQAIPIAVGMTSGGNDGSVFVSDGAVDVPLSWPGRYSHSPVEVADLRDLEALARLIRALALQ